MPCENLLQFDVTSISSDYASRFAALRVVNQENYDQMRQKLSASIPGYFDGDYQSFSLKRSKLNQLFAETGATEIHHNYFTRSLSPESARAYAECVARTSAKPIAAWVEAVTDSNIVIGLKTAVAGDTDVSFTTVGPTPINGATGTLTGGGEKALMFSYNPATDFVVAFNATIAQTGGQHMVVVELPKRRRFERHTRQAEVAGFAVAGAGGQGNTSANPLWEDLDLVAPAGHYFLPETRRVVRTEIISNPGLTQYQVEWRETKDAEERVVKMTAHPVGMNGGPHTQGSIRIYITATAEQPYIQEIVG